MPKPIPIKKDKPTLLLFTAGWCGHCKDLKQHVPKLKEMENEFYLIQTEEENDKDKMIKWQIQGYPTILIYSPEQQTFFEYNQQRTAEAIAQAVMKVKETNANENVTFAVWPKSTRGLYVLV